MATSDLALQTFLELQILKAMINNTKIEAWQASTKYDANKPIRYGGKLYICNSAHTSGVNIDLTKFDVLEASSSVDASEIAFSDSNFTATNIKAALVELFTSASNGKSTIATAITGKGGTASGRDTFSQLASAISSITGGGEISKDTRLNVTAPYTKTIVLSTQKAVEDICTSILEYTPGNEFNKYSCGFDNGDSSSFNYNSNYVMFDGLMKLITSYVYSMTNKGALGSGTLYESAVIPMDNFNYIVGISSNETSTAITATPVGQVIKANGDIDITGIAQLQGISLTQNSSNNGDVKLAVSVNGGTTWKTYYNGSWVTFNIDNKDDFDSFGMTESTIESLTYTQLEALRGGSNTIRFAYYLNRPTYSDEANTDAISLAVLLPGTSAVCPVNKYSLSYDEGTKTITYTINTSGTYTFTWTD